MTKQELHQELLNQNLSAELENLLKHSRNCIRLYQKAECESAIPLGQSKIGGQPDLPLGMEWPTENITTVTVEKGFLFLKKKKSIQRISSLSFIAQINLAQISELDRDHKLPETGMLYFFYCQDQMSWGFEQSDQQRFRVIYHDDAVSGLRRAAFPEDVVEEARFNPCIIEAREEISLPPYYHPVYDEMENGNSDKIMEIYEEMNINKLLGHPDVIQDEMELECELVTDGLYCGDPSGYNDPRAEQLRPNAKDWRLLLQIDSNEESGMMWGDAGRLYFWIKEEDLAAKRFENSWCILQCS